MKIFYILIVMLAGCQLLPTKQVTRTEYVVKQAPAEMYQLDAPITTGDFTTQRGIAEWLTLSEARMKQCESKLNSLQIYFSTDEK